MTVTREFRREIQEYASLLRALKTSATGDLSEHIFYEDVRERPAVDASSSSEVSMIPNEGRHHPLARPDKNSWSRWPLMSDEVYPPNWTFEEEVASIAERSLDVALERDESTRQLDILQPSDSLALSSTTIHAVARTLALAASNFPLVDKHSQSRVKPSGWKELLELVEAENTFPPEVVSLVRARMERMYASSTSTDRHPAGKSTYAAFESEAKALPAPGSMSSSVTNGRSRQELRSAQLQLAYDLEVVD